MTTLDKTLNIEVKASVKEKFDTLWKKYETSDFIKDDPVQFVHLFKNSRPEDIEIAGFISSLYAFGKREMFIKKLFELFNFMQMRPYEFIINFDKNAYNEDFNYRFIKPSDLIVFFDVLNFLEKRTAGKAAVQMGVDNFDGCYKNKYSRKMSPKCYNGPSFPPGKNLSRALRPQYNIYIEAILSGRVPP